MKIAIVTDSNSGITQQQAAEQGIRILPMPFMIDGETYFEDVSLSRQDFYQRLSGGEDISTSQPSPDTITDLWEDLLKSHDQIVHIPMSSALSGSCQTAMMLASDYPDSVYVVNNHRVSVTQRQAALDAKALAAKGRTGSQIKEILERTQSDSIIYVTVDTLKYLKKGGRITPAAAALGTLLKIKPVLIITGEKLDAFAKARTIKQAKTMMISAIQRDLELRFGDRDCKNCHLQIAHSQNEEAALVLKEELQDVFPHADIYVDSLALSIACHTGPGALAIACTKDLED